MIKYTGADFLQQLQTEKLGLVVYFSLRMIGWWLIKQSYVKEQTLCGLFGKELLGKSTKNIFSIMLFKTL